MIASDPRRDPAPPREATLDVGEFDSHGTARSIFNGRSIEVEHAIPGERVEALVYGRRRRWARIVDIPSPAPDRVPAPCPHFHDGCGGCPWQMVDIQSQLSRKLENVKTQFTDAGVAVDIRGVQTETDPWRYRMTAGLSVGRQAGFRRRGTQSIVAVTDCLISHPLIGRMASVLNEAIESEGIPNYHGDVSLEVRVVDREEDAGLHTCIVPSPGSRHASIDAILPLARLIAGLETTVGVLYRHNQDLRGQPVRQWALVCP
jgi:tRNA/tmRNA/rRNA uracil-C5-methylase (TrmA/RlmC/RlmD family)